MSIQEEGAQGKPPEADESEFAPVGTLAVMAILAVIILGIWLLMYFAVFVPRGAVS